MENRWIIKTGRYKQFPNGLYKLNISDPKFDTLHGLAINPIPVLSGGLLDGSGKLIPESQPIFTFGINGVEWSNKYGSGSSGMVNNIYLDNIMSILPNADFKTYNTYNKDGTFRAIISAPQGIVNNTINTVDHIIYMNDGIKGFDKDNNLLFVDLI